MRIATAKTLDGPDDAINGEVVDTINSQLSEGGDPKEVVALLRTRLRMDHPQKQYLAVHLVDQVLAGCNIDGQMSAYRPEILQEVARVMAKPAKPDTEAGKRARSTAKDLLRKYGQEGNDAFRATNAGRPQMGHGAGMTQGPHGSMAPYQQQQQPQYYMTNPPTPYGAAYGVPSYGHHAPVPPHGGAPGYPMGAPQGYPSPDASIASIERQSLATEALQNHVLAFVDKYKDDPSAPDYGVRCVRSLRTLRSTSTCSTSTWTRAAAGPRPLPAGRRGRGDLEGVETYYERFVEPEQIEALHLELATLQLEPLPKKFESLYKVCSSRREEVDGKKIKIIITPACSRRGLWTKNGFPLLALCADRLLSMHATSAARERNWSVWGHIFTKFRTRLGLIKGEMLVFIRGNSKTVIITDGDEFEEEISLEMLEEDAGGGGGGVR
ncbi:hypothetical protein FOA52_005234 [Chlamydomonas sp. UWO 241]|nr:hypothetical protein FOA52_005234 [Chlamydomonas sp. UWO 241]